MKRYLLIKKHLIQEGKHLNLLKQNYLINFLMAEIEIKYQIIEKKFGSVNWIGFWTLYKKEVLRFLIVGIQTIISPLVTELHLYVFH